MRKNSGRAALFTRSSTEGWYGTRYSAAISRALQKAGFSCRQYSLDPAKIRHSLYQLAADRPDFGLTVVTKHSASGLSLCEACAIPHLSVCIDPALLYPHLLHSPFSYLACVEESGPDFLQRAYGFTRAFFLPHAVHAVPATTAEQRYDLLFAGRSFDHEWLQSSWRKIYPPALSKQLDAAVEMAITSPHLGLEEVTRLVFGGDFFHYAHQTVAWIAQLLEWYIRGRQRYELLRALKGLRLVIVGGRQIGSRSWQELLQAQSHVRFIKDQSFGKVLQMMRESRIVLNSAPLLPYGFHERTLYGMAAGAVVLTNASPYTQRSFAADREILYYSSGTWAKTLAQVEELLAAPEKRAWLAANGRQKVASQHTWEVRTQQLLEGFQALL